MTIIDKLKKIMYERDLNKADIARGADIPYTTVDGIFKKGAEHMRLHTLLKLSKFLNVTMDSLVDDSFDELVPVNQEAPAVEKPEAVPEDADDEETTFAGHIDEGYAKELPEEAQKDLETFRRFLALKYKVKDIINE
jgi:DNA-binding Xre family transcriptional regulator